MYDLISFYTSQLYSEIFDHFRLIALPIFITHIYKNTFISVFLVTRPTLWATELILLCHLECTMCFICLLYI